MIRHRDLNPYENDNDLCDHNVELCQPCKLCEAEKLEVEEVEEVLEIEAPELSTVSG